MSESFTDNVCYLVVVGMEFGVLPRGWNRSPSKSGVQTFLISARGLNLLVKKTETAKGARAEIYS